MKRRHDPRTEALLARRRKVALRWRDGISEQAWYKRKPLDCGQPRCVVCHWWKFLGIRVPTRQERLARVRMLEQLAPPVRAPGGQEGEA